MDIRMIALDLDGTLMRSDHMTVSERNKSALEDASRRGVQIVIASGRTWSVLDSVVAQVPFVRYAVISNGAAAVDAETGNFLFRKGIPQGQAEDIYRILREYETVVEVYCDGGSYFERSKAGWFSKVGLAKDFVEMLRQRQILVDDPIRAVRNKTVEKLSALYLPQEYRKEIYNKIKAVGPLAITSALAGNMEINAAGVNKGAGLRKLCDILGVSPEETMAFGDAGNDLQMLSYVKWSFAMDNASDEAKAAARYLTASNDQDGVALAVEKYVLER